MDPIDFASDSIGHGSYAVDLDGALHGYEPGVLDALIERGLLCLAACDFCGARPAPWTIPSDLCDAQPEPGRAPGDEPASDLPDVPATVVGFVDAQDVFRGWHLASYHTGAVYRQPVNPQKDALAHRQHNQRSLDAAVACVTRLLRTAVA